MNFRIALTATILITVFACLVPAQDPEQRAGRPGMRRGGMNFERFAARFDTNKDGKISRDEFRGRPEMFDRFDTNGDGVITESDITNMRRRRGGRAGGGQMQDYPSVLLRMLDTDRNGKVSKDEMDEFFKRADSDKDGDLSPSELRESLNVQTARGVGMPRMQQFPIARPAPGQIAPKFELRTLDGKSVSLTELLKTKPVVLEFGSFT